MTNIHNYKKLLENESLTQLEASYNEELAENEVLEKGYSPHRTRIALLSSHNGWRDRNIHLFIGTAGGGKTSLLMTFLHDYLTNNSDKTVMIYASEESKDKMFSQIRTTIGDLVDKIIIFSEKDYKAKLRQRAIELDVDVPKFGHRDIVRILTRFATDYQPDIIFFDNLTTTEPYLDDDTDKIGELAKSLHGSLDTLLAPLVIFAHTKGDVKTPDFSMEEIRQKKTITLLAQYCYLIHRFMGTNFKSIIQIRKHRDYSMRNYFYSTNFIRETGLLEINDPVDRNEFLSLCKLWRQNVR